MQRIRKFSVLLAGMLLFLFFMAGCEKIAGLNKSFDIIIDDGSHASFHQQLAFTILFALLKNDGYYIIEDLLKPPKKIDFEYNPSHTTAELLMSFLKTGYFPHTHPIADSELNKYLDSIGCVSLFNQYLRENTPAQLALIYKKENSNFYKYRSKIQFIDSPASESDLGSLLKYSEISPENPYPEYHIAQIHFNNGDYQIALDHVDNALAKADFDYEISLLKILCLYEKGQCDAAFELCKITTDNAVLTENLAKDVGNHLIKRGLIDEAIRILNHCLGLCPMTSRIHYLLGRCMEENKNYTGAGNYYKSAIDILPTLLLYYKAYFRVSRLLGRKDFLPYFDDRRINFKHDKRYNLLMSRIYFYLQDYCSALREANDASQDKELQDEAEILITKTKKFME